MNLVELGLAIVLALVGLFFLGVVVWETRRKTVEK
jgi:uncharacterized iron-regulated membrane protein